MKKVIDLRGLDETLQMDRIVPELIDLELPMEGVFHNCALVSIDKKHPGQAKKVINALWGLGQMASTKFIAVFDGDIDLRDTRTVVWKLLNNVDPKRDLLFPKGRWMRWIIPRPTRTSAVKWGLTPPAKPLKRAWDGSGRKKSGCLTTLSTK